MGNNEEKLKVLFLVMEFAPVNTTGNYRSLKFVKYLREWGVEPIVVTLKEDEAASFFNAKIDQSLLREIPEGTAIYRIHCDPADKYYKNKFRSFLTIYFSIKDNLAKRWRPHLLKRIDEIIQKHQPRLVFTSMPPFSSGLLAADIAGTYNLPLIADMRDFWAMWGSTPFPTKAHYLLTLREEREIFRRAQKVIGVTPQLVNQFRSSHPSINANKFEYLPNGFDKPLDLVQPFDFAPGKSKIIIGYVGSFYYYPEGRENVFKPWWKKRGHKMLQFSPIKEDWLYRSPYFFFKAIAELLKKRPSLKEVLELHFVGNTPSWFSGMVEQFSLGAQVISHGFVSHADAANIQRSFDLILATSEKVIGAEHYCLPSKIFDYVGLGKPILGFVTEGIQREFITSSGLGVVCDPDTVAQSIAVLEGLIDHGQKFSPNIRYLEDFQRQKLAGNLCAIIKNALESQ